MNLMDSIRMDVQRIAGNTDEFATPILFESPFGATATIPGTRTKHHTGIDREGFRANSKTASVTVSEAALVESLYTFRNSKGEVDLKNHKVSFVDSSGASCKYVISEWFPDQTLGLIVCILRDFQ